MSVSSSPQHGRRRVVITGIGPVSASGIGIEPLWNDMLAGNTAIGSIRAFDPSGFHSGMAGELPADVLNIRKIVPKNYRKATKVMCRDIELAIAAADAAVRDAGLNTTAIDPDFPPGIPPERFGCHIGAGLIAADLDEITAALVTSTNDAGDDVDLADWGASGMENLTPLWLLKYLPNMLACHVTIVHECRAASNTITCCEASAVLSLGESMRVIQRGSADGCLTGGAESRLNPLGLVRQQFAKRLAPTAGHTADAIVRPFASDANGTVLGEGGGILVLEALDTAVERGATPLVEVTGYAATQSWCSTRPGLNPDQEGTEIADAMRTALDGAGIDADAIGAIVPLGSGIVPLDAAEANAICSVFDGRAAEIPLVTTVPYTGNCCAGNGAIALAVGVKCIIEQHLPARINSGTNPGELNAAAAPAQSADLEHIMVVTTSQNGQNAAAVLSRIA